MSGAPSVRSAVVALRADDLDPVDDGRVRVLRPLAAEDDADLLLLDGRRPSARSPGRRGRSANSPACSAVGPVRVAEVVQPVDELVRRQRLAAVQLERAGEDAGIDPLHFAVDPRVDHPREEDVVVAHDRRQDDERAGEADQREELPARLRRGAHGPFLAGLALAPAVPGRWSSSRLETRLFRMGHQRRRQLTVHLRYRLDRRCHDLDRPCSS